MLNHRADTSASWYGCVAMSLLTAVDQIQGPSASTWWVYVLAGVGVGGIVSSLVTLVGQRWQRRHEVHLEEIRDLQHLRDTRLERLREDLREVLFAAFDLQEITFELDVDAAERPDMFERAIAKYDSSVERFRAARGRLLLDPDSVRVQQPLTELGLGVEALFQTVREHRSHDHGQAAVAFRERRDEIARLAMPVIDQAQQLLQEVEGQPLYKRPGWWSRWRHKRQ